MRRQKGIMSQAARLCWAATLQLCGAVALVLAACRAEAQYDPGWTKNFRLGALSSLGVKGQIRLRGAFTVNNSDPSSGIYDDGYVRTDDTGNAGGLTSFWGFDNASQYDNAAHTLTLHSASDFTASGTSSLDQQFTVGLELAYGNKLKQWGRTSLGWEFGFGFMPLSLKSDSTVSGGKVKRTTIVLRTGGVIILGPSYHGTASSIAPLIDPNDIVSTTTEEVDGEVRERGTLDASLFTFRLGPTLFYDVSPHFGLAGGIGPAFGIASQTLHYNELITFSDGTTARSKGSFGSTDLVYGAYVNVIATYHADDNGDIYVGVQYMPMSGSTFSQGGREASLNLMGQIYFMVGVNWIF